MTCFVKNKTLDHKNRHSPVGKNMLLLLVTQLLRKYMHRHWSSRIFQGTRYSHRQVNSASWVQYESIKVWKHKSVKVLKHNYITLKGQMFENTQTCDTCITLSMSQCSSSNSNDHVENVAWWQGEVHGPEGCGGGSSRPPVPTVTTHVIKVTKLIITIFKMISKSRWTAKWNSRLLPKL